MLNAPLPIASVCFRVALQSVQVGFPLGHFSATYSVPNIGFKIRDGEQPANAIPAVSRNLLQMTVFPEAPPVRTAPFTAKSALMGVFIGLEFWSRLLVTKIASAVKLST